MPDAKPSVTRAAASVAAAMGAGVAVDAMSAQTVELVSALKVAARLARTVEAMSAVNPARKRAAKKHVVMTCVAMTCVAMTCVAMKHAASSVATCAVDHAASKTSKARNSAKRARRMRLVSHVKAAVLSVRARGVEIAGIALNAVSARQSNAL